MLIAEDLLNLHMLTKPTWFRYGCQSLVHFRGRDGGCWRRFLDEKSPDKIDFYLYDFSHGFLFLHENALCNVWAGVSGWNCGLANIRDVFLLRLYDMWYVIQVGTGRDQFRPRQDSILLSYQLQTYLAKHISQTRHSWPGLPRFRLHSIIRNFKSLIYILVIFWKIARCGALLETSLGKANWWQTDKKS